MAKHADKQATREGPASGSPLDKVVVHGTGISVDRAHAELPLAEARSRFGGVNLPSIAAGALAGLGMTLLLGAVVTAVGAEIAQGDGDTVAVAALVTALVVLALAGLVAGWVAGRCARFDGARNGLLSGLLMSLLLIGLGAAGAYSAAETGLPVSLDSDRVTTAALIAAGAGLLVSALAGLLGGRLGRRWHRTVDDVIVGTRPGAVTKLDTQVVR